MSKNSSVSDKIHLSERQWDMWHFLKKTISHVWIGAVNRRVANALIEKGLAEINKEGDLHLTKLGKTIEL